MINSSLSSSATPTAMAASGTGSLKVAKWKSMAQLKEVSKNEMSSAVLGGETLTSAAHVSDVLSCSEKVTTK